MRPSPKDEDVSLTAIQMGSTRSPKRKTTTVTTGRRRKAVARTSHFKTTQLQLAVTQPSNKYSPYRVPSPDDDPFSKCREVLPKCCESGFRVLPPSQPHLLKLRHSVPSLPEASWADVHIVWNLMCWKDRAYQRHRNANWRLQHPTLNWKMRHILLDWLAEVCAVYQMLRETFHLTVDLFDRFMNVSRPVKATDLQLIGISCLFIAAKVEEIYPPKIEQFAYVTDEAYTVDRIRSTELIILSMLKWSLSPMTAVHWLSIYLQIIAQQGHNIENQGICQRSMSLTDMLRERPSTARRALFTKNAHQNTPSGCVDVLTMPNFDTTAFMSVCQLLDLCMLDDGWMSFEYGMLAASALYLMAVDPSVALKCSGFRTGDLSKCVEWMKPFSMLIGQLDAPCRPVSRSFSASYAHNIQTHCNTFINMIETTLPQMRT